MRTSPGLLCTRASQWAWESFPEYLDALASRRLGMDIGTQVPHGAVRTYVMGERGRGTNETATTADIEAMAAIVREGMRGGALGFSTSRTIAHRAIRTASQCRGPSLQPTKLFGIGRDAKRDWPWHLRSRPGRVLRGEDILAPKTELDWMLQLSKEIGRPVTFAMVQVDPAPDLWRELLDRSTPLL